MKPSTKGMRGMEEASFLKLEMTNWRGKEKREASIYFSPGGGDFASEDALHFGKEAGLTGGIKWE